MTESLLAHLTFALTPQIEVVATRGLAYVLEKSPVARQAMLNIVSLSGIGLPNDLRLECEVSGEHRERPDIVGTTKEGKEVLIIEGKFFAGLTDNQPETYLERLPRDTPGILLFVVPEFRLQTLWREIVGKAKASVSGTAFEHFQVGSVNESHRIGATTWRHLLQGLSAAAAAAGDPVVSDIAQLAGVCERMDEHAFVPLSSEEISSAMVARRIQQYTRLVDEVVDQLVARHLCTTQGLRAAPAREGYVRYLRLGDVVGIGLGFDPVLWRRHGISPLWVSSFTSNADKLRDLLSGGVLEEPRRVFEERKPRLTCLPVPVLANVGHEELLKHCVGELEVLHKIVVPRWPAEAFEPVPNDEPDEA